MVEKGNRRRAFIVKQMAQLEKELAAIEADLLIVQGNLEREKLEEKAEQWLARIETLEEKLDSLDARSPNPTVKDRSLDKVLQKIDFAIAKDIARSVQAALNPDGGTVLFFLQKSKMQMGNYCIEEVIHILINDDGCIEDRKRHDYRRISVDLGSAISQYDQTEFLIRLGSYFNVEAGEDMIAVSEQLRSAIRQAIDQGMTIFLEIKSVDEVLKQETFIAWFIKDFWKPLTDEVRSVSGKYGSQFIVALIADSPMLLGCSGDYFGSGDGFDCYKILELPLPNWTEQDIFLCLQRIRSLSASMTNTNPELQKLAEKIWRDSGHGIPQNVCCNLREQFL